MFVLWFKRFCVLSVACAALFSTLSISYAMPEDLYSVFSDEYSFVSEDIVLPVRLVPEDPVFDVYSFASSYADVVTIEDVPPDRPLFYGSGYITGVDSRLGTVTLYFPINYSDGYWGIDSNGYLYNINSASMSGYLSGVYNNSVSASGFSYPRYRLSNTGTYTDLLLKPVYSNMNIATTMVPQKSPESILPYLTFVGIGVLVLCFMKRS